MKTGRKRLTPEERAQRLVRLATLLAPGLLRMLDFRA